MAKIRVYEYAKQMKMSSKEVLNILERMDMKLNNHMSVMNEGMIQKVEQYINEVKKSSNSKEEKPQGEKKPKQNPNAQKNQGQNRGARQNNRPNQQSPRNQNKRQANDGANDAQSAGTSNAGNAFGGKKSDNNRKGKFNKANGGKGNASSGSGGKGGRNNRRKGDRRGSEQREKQAPVLPKEITVSGPLSVGDFAKLLRREASAVIKKLLMHGVMATINQEIDVETMVVIGDEFDVKVQYVEEVDESNFEEQVEEDAPEDLVERPPVVTIMGHVDHGKTTLLDKIRHTNVTAGEAGGITQHIGAYQVEVSGKKITFLDTPGHAAFTTMRARGAQVTDITILVVAADDGVMPQTIEAINHAKAAEVPIIVAVNKIDKPDSNPDRVKQQLTEHGLVPEEWGGDTIFVPVSALAGTGIDELLEMILLVAEVQEYKANPNKRARGVVIEAELDKGRGPVATVLVQNGTLKVGDGVVAGNFFGKIRAMVNDRGRRVKVAPPSMPVEILGLPDVPNAGDQFMVFEDEKKGRAIADKRLQKQREEELGANSRVSLDDLFKQIQQGEVKDLNVIIKADVQGSAEALRGSLEKIDVEGARVKIIHQGAGAITESDIILASASNAIVIGFNVRPEPNARAMAEQEKVDIRLHRIIYNVIEEIEAAMKGLLDPEFEERVVGTAEVRQIFKVSKVGTIAGCYVTEGKVVRDGHVRLIRDGVVVHEGKLDTLKRFKDDAKEVAQGYECGLTVQNYNDIKEGDVIEVYVIEEVERT
ncbi:translation initiation factor 2 (bIF-2) [Laceyella sacchari]|uniref:Translation initiation factor IF-2 n=2 Tax=Laceyella sacchari TaxID=37482 RepID=A0ABY5TYI5_LACSH|nr:translation initiation factor IF-2 [Laceyella sacchari]TCW35666.1 translation initiation factor 2 (bIF-2) [Laceyella sacchari]UWE02489.1 translation initiation factor IF-2 [Laceyella sacchari]